MRALRAGVLAAGVLLLLTGCRSEVETLITVESASEAGLTAQVRFHEEAADAVLADASIDEQVRATLIGRTGASPGDLERSTDADARSVTYSVAVPYESLESASSILGVTSAELVPSGDGDQVTVNTELVYPDELAEAIRMGTEGEVDSEAVLATVLATTEVVVTVEVPGSVTDASGPGVVTQDGSRASMRSSLDAFEAGTFSVTGGSEAPLLTPVTVGAGVLVVLAGAVALVVRKRRS